MLLEEEETNSYDSWGPSQLKEIVDGNNKSLTYVILQLCHYELWIEVQWNSNVLYPFSGLNLTCKVEMKLEPLIPQTVVQRGDSVQSGQTCVVVFGLRLRISFMRSTRRLHHLPSQRLTTKIPQPRWLYVLLHTWSSLTANVHQQPDGISFSSCIHHWPHVALDWNMCAHIPCSMCAYLHAVQLHATEPSQTCFTPTPLSETCDVRNTS